MIELRTKIHVAGLSGAEIYGFLLNAGDEDYRRWWRGTHLALHTIERRPNDIGNVIYMDEFIGSHRVKMKAVVLEAEPGRRLTMQFKKLIPLPAWLFLEFEDRDGGVTVTHTLRAGYKGIGRLLDPLLRLHFTKQFEKDLDAHVRTEFPKLRDLLSSTKNKTPAISPPQSHGAGLISETHDQRILRQARDSASASGPAKASV